MSWRISRRRRLSSSRSAVVRPSARRPSSRSACATQLRIACADGSNSFASSSGPRQQWSLRAQQILAYESDLLDYGDIFDGSPAIAKKVEELKTEARDELRRILEMGGAVDAVETGYLKAQLVESNSRRVDEIELGERIIVGVNKFVETEPSPLPTGEGSIITIPPEVEASQIANLQAWRAARDQAAVDSALNELRRAAREGRNVMPASIACAKAGVTTGEWGFALRDAFGEYRAPTGVSSAARNDARCVDEVRTEVDRVSRKLGRRLKFLIGKPGLDGHSNGAEQVAVRARDAGMDVVYEGIRFTPADIVKAARDKNVHVVGLVDPVRLAHAAGEGSGDEDARGGPRPHPGRGRRHHPAG